MLEGIFTEKVLNHETIRAYPPQPQDTSGYYIGTQSVYRYALKESDYPTLIIPDPLYDNDGNIIVPGYYELALSDEKDFLILMQSKKVVAIVPVIKIEEDANEQQRLDNPKVKKQQKKEKKERDIVNNKRKKVEMPPDEPDIYMEATIEYISKDNYYLIKYQRGIIKAWGAFKG